MTKANKKKSAKTRVIREIRVPIMKNSQTYPFINTLLSAWKATGKPMGIDAYLRITQLVEALPDETNLEDLKTLLAPIITTSPQQQADFYETFNRVLKNFDTSPVQNTPSVFSWKKALKWLGLGLGAAIMVSLLWLLYKQLNPIQIEKPIPIQTFRRVVDIDRDTAGQKDKMSEFFGFQNQPTPLEMRSFEQLNVDKSAKSTNFKEKHIFLDIDTVARTLFYKPVSVGDDTVHFKFCLSNDTCYEQIHVFSVQHIKRKQTETTVLGPQIPLKPHKHEPDISTLVVKNDKLFSFKNGYLSAWKWLLLLFITGVLGSIYYFLKLREDKKQQQKKDEEAAKLDRKPNSAPPFIWQVQIPDAEKVSFDAVFSRITTQLRRRSEIEHQIFDPKRTIQATIAKAGLATFRYRQPTRADEYLFLIDVHNANDHRGQVFDLLYRTLLKNEVLVERFFYDGDLRLCWNEAFRQGIRLNELAHRFGESRLVVVGSAASLLNPNVHELMAWTSVFDAWRQRVLLTPRSPLEWNAVERLLATKFRILPANLKGLEAMPDTFDAIDAPDFRKWRTVKDPDFEPIRLPEVLNEAAIMAYLEMTFTVYKNGKTDNRMLLWLAACAVPPVLHWDTTLFFGNWVNDLEGKTSGESDLVSLDNLFKINRLSWFLEGKLPDKARRALLNFLEKEHPSVYQRVRDAWDTVLQDNLAAARKAAKERGEDFDKSAAFDDLRLQMIVNELKRGGLDADKREALLTELRGLTRGGTRGDIVALEILEKERNTPMATPTEKPHRPLWQRVLAWAAPLWLLAFLGIFCYNGQTDNCDGAKVKYRGNVLCIASERDYLTLYETYETEFLSRDTSAPQPIDSTNGTRFDDLDKTIRTKYGFERTPTFDNDTQDIMLQLLMLRKNGLDSASFCRNLAIGYYNVAVNYLNHGKKKDSACMAYVRLKDWHWKDSVLTKAELSLLNDICSQPIASKKLPKAQYPEDTDYEPYQQNGKFGYRHDITKKSIISLQYEGAYFFKEGLGAVKQKGKWGFIDKNNAFVIPPQFDDVDTRFNNGIARVMQGDKAFCIDRTGKVVDCVGQNKPNVPPQYKDDKTTEIEQKTTQNAQKGIDIDPKSPQRITPIESITDSVGKVVFEMVKIKGGTFDMGDVFDDNEDKSEKPVHSATLSNFYMGAKEVTQAQWKAIMGDNPSNFKGDDLPVEQVSWDDIQEFLKKLNVLTGKKYRLPTEAEWEYAAREGGKKVRFGNGKDIADPKEINFDGRETYKNPYSVVGVYRGKTTPVGSFSPNVLGLYDMSGNVWEWCSDWYRDYTAGAVTNPTGAGKGTDRVIRGGGWYDSPQYCRVAYRNANSPTYRDVNLGFRVVLIP